MPGGPRAALGVGVAAQLLRWTQDPRCPMRRLVLSNTFLLETEEDVTTLTDACRGRDRPVTIAITVRKWSIHSINQSAEFLNLMIVMDRF